MLSGIRTHNVSGDGQLVFTKTGPINQCIIFSFVYPSGVKKSTSPGLVISTFGLAEIISSMPDGLVKKYIGYLQTCQYSCIYLYSYTV